MTDGPSVEEAFAADESRISRIVRAGSQRGISYIESKADRGDDLRRLWDGSVLRGQRPQGNSRSKSLKIGELFCGAGGLGLGAQIAVDAIGIRPQFEFAVDEDTEALEVYGRNLEPGRCVNTAVNRLVDFTIRRRGDDASFAYEPDVLVNSLPYVDVLLAGPPCQGHSNLNNKTRRTDPKNSLYLTVPALAVALRTPIVIIENVPAVANDKSGVLATAKGLLQSAGYFVRTDVLHATRLGVAQTRKRSFLIACRAGMPATEEAHLALARDQLNTMEAIDDLQHVTSAHVFDCAPTLDAVTRERIDFLFDNDAHDLPDAQRPDCHRNGHTYKSVYGRLWEDRPAYTITQGFGVMGRGRFVHPCERRTITPHEAARLQGFPDWFDWHLPNGYARSRVSYAKLIGNAVPPIMGTAACLAAMGAHFALAPSASSPTSELVHQLPR